MALSFSLLAQGSHPMGERENFSRLASMDLRWLCTSPSEADTSAVESLLRTIMELIANIRAHQRIFPRFQ
jgi:hypothetical protein